VDPIVDALAPSSRFILHTSEGSGQRNSVPHATIADIPVDIGVWKQELSDIWPDLVSVVTEADRSFGLGRSICYEILSHLSWAVANILRSEIILDTQKPEVVVTEHDRHPVDAVLCQVAKMLSIPTVTLTHGIQGDPSAGNVQWTPLIADRIIVWGEWMRDYFVDLGVPADRIDIGGYPRLRDLTAQDKIEASRCLMRQGEGGKPHVLMLSSSLGPDKLAVRMFLEVQAQFSDVRFMIRPHPQESLEWYRRELSGGLGDIQSPEQWTIEQSLASADVVVGSGSTACLDALLLGKRLVLLPDSGLVYDRIPILRDAIMSGLAHCVASGAELNLVLHKLLDRHARTSGVGSDGILAIKRYACCIGQEAAETSAAAISKSVSS
jgi:hypothetical protein